MDGAKDADGTRGGIQIDRRDVDAFRARQLRLSRLLWIGLFGLAVACGVVIAAVSSVGLGFVVLGIIGLLGSSAVKRWNRARWLARFPELRQGGFEREQGSTSSRNRVDA